MSSQEHGWIAAPDAVERYGISYNLLRKLVAEGVFTRGRFSTAAQRPPIYVRTAELDAWKAGGVNAVAPIRDAFTGGSQLVAGGN